VIAALIGSQLDDGASPVQVMPASANG